MTFIRARERTGAWRALRASILGVGAGLAAALAGCSATTLVSNGTPVITTTTTAAGDFSAYVVSIYGITLTRKDGYVDYIPPGQYGLEELVDLTRRVDLTELLQAPGVPTGTYTQASITLDYSAATGSVIYLKGQSTAATVHDSSGNTPSTITVTVKFDPAQPLVISLNHSTPLALDFDLAASNSVDASTNTVTVRPFVVANPTAVGIQQVRARGLLVTGDTQGSYLVENIRPFEDSYYGPVGALKVSTSSTTYFNVDGKVYQGGSGLAAIAALPANTPITAYGAIGDLSTITPAFTATEVYAGTAVANTAYQSVKGIVTARSGNTLTVSGIECIDQEGISPQGFNYYPTATVTVGPSTLVTEDGVASVSVSPQSISVGQRIDAVGAVGNGNLCAASPVSLDATSGWVRLESTSIWGTLSAGAAGSATLALGEIGPYAPSAFNFAGTGTTSANDANPASYLVNTGTVDESATAAGTLLNAYGFATPFGSAPPDFDATSVTPTASQESDFIVEWTSGTTAPFTSYDGSSLVLNLSGATVEEVVTGPQTTALAGTPSVSIAGSQQLAIGNDTNGISVFSTPTAFASDLTSTLNGSTKVFKLVAIGSYDASTNTFTANRVDLALE
jgi:hypothetical protein